GPRLLGRRRVLRLEAGTLGMATRSESLDPRPLRRARILIRQRFAPIDIQTIGLAKPQCAKRKRRAVARQPSRYRTLRRKLIDDAPGMYRAVHVTSAIAEPRAMICARIWLSKTKSSEFPDSGSRSNNWREKAR